MPILLALSLLGAGAVMLARAQDRTDLTIQSLELDNAEIRIVLKTIFQKAKASFTVDPELQGRVTMRVHDLPFHTVLDHVVRQVNASYAIDQSGVYHFMPKAPRAAASSALGSGIAVDESFVYVMRGNTLSKVDKVTMKPVQRHTFDASNDR